MFQLIRTLALPLAMLAGFLFDSFLAKLGPYTPYLIFTMLFVTFCRITPREMGLKPQHIWLVIIQILGSIVIYLLFRLTANAVIAQGVMICVLAPTATAAVVIAGMLGANIASMATFTLLSNVAVAVMAPTIFSLIGTNADMPFFDSFLLILKRIMPLLLLPFVVAYVLLKLAPKIHAAVSRMQMVSFWLWVASILIVTGQIVNDLRAKRGGDYTQEYIIAATALVICLVQFAVGRLVGARYGDKEAGAQSLGQKNTILAIWMSQTYLHPVASIGPASYVLWQNLVNSWQMWQLRGGKNREDKQEI